VAGYVTCAQRIALGAFQKVHNRRNRMIKGIDIEYLTIKAPEYSDWQCYMFGSRPDNHGMIYRPIKGYEPSWFVRWMMKVCFDCLWIKKETE
jgi:hypothetical protein